MLKRILLASAFVLGICSAQPAVKRDFGCTPATASGTTYACNISPAPAALVTNETYYMVADVANTGTTTINFNALGAKTVKTVAGGVTTNLVANDIRAGQIVVMRYDGTNMQMVSQSGNAAVGGSSGVTFQDEGSQQGTSQTTVNCVGSGITCSSSGATSTLTVSGGGFDPTDSTTFWLRDEFIRPYGPLAGSLGWQLVAFGSSCSVGATDGTFSHPAIIQLSTASNAAGDGCSIVAGDSANSFNYLGSIGANANWTSYYIFKLSSTANVDFRVGYTNPTYLPNLFPAIGIWLRYSSGTDSNFVFEVRDATTSTTSTTNSVAADTAWHCVRIRSTVSGQIGFAIGSTCAAVGTETVLSSNVPAGIVTPFITVVSNTSAASKILQMDLFAYQSTGLSR